MPKSSKGPQQLTFETSKGQALAERASERAAAERVQSETKALKKSLAIARATTIETSKRELASRKRQRTQEPDQPSTENPTKKSKPQPKQTNLFGVVSLSSLQVSQTQKLENAQAFLCEQFQKRIPRFTFEEVMALCEESAIGPAFVFTT